MPTARYWRYDEMWTGLREFVASYPALIEVIEIGTSREGRVIPAAILTNQATGASDAKSAVLVDANIHAGEVAGNAVAMYWIAECLAQYGTDAEITRLLDDHTVYVIPRIAVDGAEAYLTTPATYRSSPHFYPHSTPPDGHAPDDINGDGLILWMRVPAEDGGFVIDEVDPRVMRYRRPGEFDKTFYHVFPEGRVVGNAQKGTRPPLADVDVVRRSAMDFNRNFPIRWAGESGQSGAGPFPLSEPELRALADFVHAHTNIAAYAALHTSGGVILRQPSTGDDTELSETDRSLFTQVADMGAEVSGYFAGSNYEKFASGHEKVLMPGAADDWMYDHLGVLGFTVEIWDLMRRSGARGYGEHGVRALMKLKPDELTADDRKVWAWVTENVPDGGAYPWTSFRHPDYGDVEIGGLHPKYVLQNPPPHLLEEECRALSPFLTRLGLSTPRLTIPSLTTESLGDGVYRIVVEVSNAGFLPTSSTDKGRSVVNLPVRSWVEGGDAVITGTSPCDIGHLNGFGEASRWNTPKGQRAVVEWLIRAKAGTEITVMVGGGRAGRVVRSVTV